MSDAHTIPWALNATDTLVLAHPIQHDWNRYQRCQVHSVEPDGRHLPVAGFTNAEDARRAVACVNACRGIPTESLERNQPLADQIVDALNQRDTALERVAHLEGLLKRVRDDTEWSCMPAELQDDIIKAVGTGPVCPGGLPKCKWITHGTGSKCTTCGDTLPF